MYHVLATDNVTMILDDSSGLRIQVNEKDKVSLEEHAPYCLGTLYRFKGGFTRTKLFVLRTLSGAGLEMLKAAVDFFFLTLLETDLYIKEVPRDSSFFDEEALRIYGTSSEQALKA